MRLNTCKYTGCETGIFMMTFDTPYFAYDAIPHGKPFGIPLLNDAHETAISAWYACLKYIYIYVIYRLRGPDEKNCARGLDIGNIVLSILSTITTII